MSPFWKKLNKSEEPSTRNPTAHAGDSTVAPLPSADPNEPLAPSVPTEAVAGDDALAHATTPANFKSIAERITRFIMKILRHNRPVDKPHFPGKPHKPDWIQDGPILLQPVTPANGAPNGGGSDVANG